MLAQQKRLFLKIKEVYPQLSFENVSTAYGAMSCINAQTGIKFVVIIDEWDVLIRDVLTLLIHLGYLAYNQSMLCAYIPNEEIRQELLFAVKRKKWNELNLFLQDSEELLDATLDKEEQTAAEKTEKIHSEYISSIQYNNENSLSCVLSIAYLSAMQYYFKPIREFPTGRGFADFVFIPKTEYKNEYPAIVAELKWNKNAQTAIDQIKERHYPQSLLQYTGKILLVGINYDKKTKKHSCKIEEWSSQ